MSGYQNDPGTVQQEAGFGFNGRFWTESFNDGMTATPSGTQANSILLDSMFCRVSTVTTVNDGVKLPPAFGGPGSGALILCVINDSANAMTVFGSGSDTVNGQPGATGIIQMGKSVVYYQNTQNGKWIAQGLGFGYATGNSASFNTDSFQDNITAHSGGGQASAFAITALQSRITTVAVANDSVVLPPAIAGMSLSLLNDAAANAANVFPASQSQGGVSGGDKINNGAQNAAFSLAAQNGAGTGPTIFYCFTTGTWRTK